MSEDVSKNEMEAFLADLEAAQRDGPPWGYLKKGESATRNLSRLSSDAVHSVGSLGMRAVYHSDRLLEEGRSREEREFAEALVNNASELMKSLRSRQDYRVRSVVSGEGSDCCLWWTLSPYIYAELRPKVGEKEAVRLLLKWAQSGRPFNETEGREVNLQGLERYNSAGQGSNCTFTLGSNPNSESHKFARGEAHRLVLSVFPFRHSK